MIFCTHAFYGIAWYKFFQDRKFWSTRDDKTWTGDRLRRTGLLSFGFGA